MGGCTGAGGCAGVSWRPGPQSRCGGLLLGYPPCLHLLERLAGAQRENENQEDEYFPVAVFYFYHGSDSNTF